MDRLRLLVREPALLLQLAENLIAVLVVLNISVNHEQETWIMAILVALIGVAKGLSTHPFPVHFVTDLARAVLMCAIAFGLNLSPDKAVVIVTFVGTATALIGSIRTTPANDPIERPGGAGAGPVTTRTEAGFASPLAAVGVVLIVLGLVLWLAFGYLVLGVILLVLGVVLLLVPAYRGRGTYL